jgi:hypothetical protein
MEPELKGQTGRRLELCHKPRFFTNDGDNNVILPPCANVVSDRNFKAMRGPPRAERCVCDDAGELPGITGVEVGVAKGLNEMETNPNIKKVPNDQVFYVSAADLADKIIVLMQYGLDPLLLSTSTWALVQTSQCHAIN